MKNKISIVMKSSISSVFSPTTGLITNAKEMTLFAYTVI